jgi:hypothetical protein
MPGKEIDMTRTARTCDAPGCDREANTIHVIPDVPDCREVKLACPEHSFARNGEAVDLEAGDNAGDAYWFEITRWDSGEMQTHIRTTKINGEAAAEKITSRLSA